MSVPKPELSTREIGHELNNIFASLAGFTELLLDDLPARTPPHNFALKIMQGQMEAERLVLRLLAKAAD